MVTFKQALELLRVEETASKEMVEKQYQKFKKRYPAISFPERSEQIDMAYRVLTQNGDYWRQFLNEEYQQLEWLKQLFDDKEEVEEEREADTLSTFSKDPQLSLSQWEALWANIIH